MDEKPIPIASLSDHASGQFEPHGELAVHVEGQVLHSRICGPMNCEAIEAYGRMRAEIFSRWRLTGAYALLSVWEQSMLMSPQALALYEASLEIYRQGAPAPCAVAWVAPADIEGRAIMLPKLAAMLNDAGMPFRAFESQTEAAAWVAERLAPV